MGENRHLELFGRGKRKGAKKWSKLSRWETGNFRKNIDFISEPREWERKREKKTEQRKWGELGTFFKKKEKK